VETKTNPAAATADATAQMQFVVVDAPVATGVTVTSSLPSSQQPGTPVTFTAAGVGSSGYVYRFLLSTNGGAFVEQQAFSTLGTWTLPGTTPEGQYQVSVEVRANPNTVSAEATSSPFPFTIRLGFAAATGVTISPSRASPAPRNIVPVPTTFTAAGQGSTGAYQYRFSLSSNGGAFALVQDYGIGSTWTMVASTPIGNYVVKVDVRTSALVDLDATNTLSFQIITPPPATGVTVTPGLVSPQPPGTAVTFTAAGQGSSGYQYLFFLSSNAGATWLQVTNWSTNAVYTLPTFVAAGDYLVRAQVRTTTAVVFDAVSANVPFSIRSPPATGVSVSATPVSPQVTGTAISFTAAGQGSTNYSYRFLLSSNNGLTWTLVRDWSVNPTYVLPTFVAAANYLVNVEVRTSSLVVRDASAIIPFTIVPPAIPPATGVTVTANLPSPQAAGTPILFTAAGQGSSNYTYRFFLSSDGGATWIAVTNWTTNAAYTLPGWVARATYLVNAEVRTTTTVTRDAVSPNVSFTIQ